jgi:hypothetical protein
METIALMSAAMRTLVRRRATASTSSHRRVRARIIGFLKANAG